MNRKSKNIERFLRRKGTGPFVSAEPLSIANGARIDGDGRESFQITTAPDVAQDYHLLMNANPVWPGGERIDRDITIERTGFLGQSGMPAIHDFVDFIGVDTLTLRDDLFANRDRDLLVLSNCHAPTVDNCLFRNWGGALPDDPGQGHYAGGMAINCLTPSTDGSITKCRFYHGAGGVWIPVVNTFDPPAQLGKGWTVSGNFFRFLTEVGIVGGDCAVIIGNQIYRVVLADVSGHGMELHGYRLFVTFNTIEAIDGVGIYAAMMYHSIISQNTIMDIGRVNRTGSIVLATFPPEAGQGNIPPHHVQILDNDLVGGYILLANNSGDPTKLMTDITIRSKDPVLFWPSKETVVGAGFDCQAPALGTLPAGHAPPSVNRISNMTIQQRQR